MNFNDLYNNKKIKILPPYFRRPLNESVIPKWLLYAVILDAEKISHLKNEMDVRSKRSLNSNQYL